MIKHYLMNDDYRASLNGDHRALREARELRARIDREHREHQLFMEGVIWGVIGSGLAWAALAAALWITV